MRIAHITAEAFPWAKVGGLADAVTGLARALAQAGHEVTLLLPGYRSVSLTPDSFDRWPEVLYDHLAFQPVRAFVWGLREAQPFHLWVIDIPEYFDRSGIYADPQRGEYWDDMARYVAFVRMALRALETRRWIPDVLHLHDWHAAPAVAWLRYDTGAFPTLETVSIVLTVHNLAYQGVFLRDLWPWLNLSEQFLHPEAFEFYGRVNLLKAALLAADAVTTVSPSYAEEIQRPEYGHGLDGLLRHLRSKLVGILNGIDTDVWDPARDPYLPAHYDVQDLAGKRVCKAYLLQTLGLTVPAEAPLCGMVSRLTYQKGIDLLLEAIPWIVDQGAGLVVQGTGEAAYEDGFRRAVRLFPGRVVYVDRYDEAMAHQIEAGCDIYLMPSRFEPCGLNQMYSLRYGTVPVVRAVGGLRDTVIDVREAPQIGTGFRFEPPTTEALVATLQDAFDFYKIPDLWHTLILRGMAQDFSWRRAARRYTDLYERIVRR
ncbi:MAG: glycogen synthase GlgA [Acidobacteria bacterium]|nr:glycogen synthase GlgA [Acidobacteriota bacterium]MDW7983194.1 glycogen synthase GlgA [Acidobacteriota bacterium]